MIQSKKDYLYYLAADKISLGITRRWPPLICIYESDVIWKFQRLLRKAEYLHNCRNRGLAKIYYKWVQYKLFHAQLRTGFSIPMNVFGPGLSISHIGPITINGFAKVGKNCRLHPNTCIGIDGRKSGVAKIGDNCYISTGAKIIGDITICDDVCIGANAVVVKDIHTSGTTWGGAPAKQIATQGSPFPLNRRGADLANKK